MKKVVFVAPHLSTGGMPQYLYKLISQLNDVCDVYCIEYRCISDSYTVQRNRIKNLLGEKFFALQQFGNPVTIGLYDILDSIDPDIVHLQEMPEFFMDGNEADKLYRSNRSYFIVETSHDSSFSANNKRYYPDHFALISEFQKNEFSKLNIPIDLVEYDIDWHDRPDRDTTLRSLGLDPNIKHVLNVGLFTPRKNQAEIFEYAKELDGYPIQFHFVGNTAGNFKDYWEPLLSNPPSNVKVWGERGDVDTFYSCMDLFLFTSKGTDKDKETSPLVIREAIGHRIPTLIYNLPVYLNMYDKYNGVTYLDFDSKENNRKLILESLQLKTRESQQTELIHTLDGEKDLASLPYGNSMVDAINRFGEAAGMYWGAFVHNELERSGLDIETGDVFVDLGANIGVSSLYAKHKGASRIYAFEPDPTVLELYKKNIKKATVFNYAIGDNREDSIELYHWPYNHVNEGPKYSVDKITLKDAIDMIPENIIDYLKIDIEGFEEGMFNTLPKTYFKRIRKLFIEHHNDSTLQDMVEVLGDNGFDVKIEKGAGQNYVYARQTALSDYNTAKFVTEYNSRENKIVYTALQEVKDFSIVVRDLDSRAVIWCAKNPRLPERVPHWVVPIPKGFFDFETDPSFGGLLIEMYSGDKLLYDKSYRIKEPNINKHIVEVDTTTEPIFINYNEFFVDGIYDNYINEDKRGLVVDVGANVGLWSEWIRHRCSPEQLVLVEPNKVAVDVLQRSYGESVQIIDGALTPNDGELEFFVDPTNSTISSIRDHTYGKFSTMYKVRGLSIKTLLNEIGPNNFIDLMKIDIESAEYDLLDSFDKDDFRRIGEFLIEWHIVDDYTYDTHVVQLGELLEKAGYDVTIRREHNTGGFIHAKAHYDGLPKTNLVVNDVDYPLLRSKKVKAVQFQVNKDLPQQEESYKNVRGICERLGIEYTLHKNDVWVDKPPTFNCQRPNDVIGPNEAWRPHALTPAHYGCFDSFKTAFLSEFDSSLDLLIVFEGDAKIQDANEFARHLEQILDPDIVPHGHYASLGGRYDLDAGYLQSQTNSEITPDLITTDKIIGCQCLVFPKYAGTTVRYMLREASWDALDIWFNTNADRYNMEQVVSNKTVVTQFDGYSIIDDSNKTFKEFTI